MIDGYLLRNRLLRKALKVMDQTMGLFGLLRQRRPVPTDVKKILVIKPDHLGDVVLSFSILPALKKKYPQAQVHFLCGRWAKELAEGNPYIFQVHYLDHFMLNRQGGGGRFKKLGVFVCDLRSFYQTVRRERFDLALDLRAYFPNFLPFLFFADIRCKIGFNTAGFGFVLDRSIAWREDVHETEHFLDVVKALDLEAEIKEIDLSYLVRGSKQPGKKICVLHPGAGRRVKQWDLKNWQELAVHLSAQGWHVRVTGGGKDRALGESITCGLNAQNLCGKTTIPELAQAVYESDCVIGVDSFVAHLSAALGVKTIALFNGIEKPGQWKPLGKDVRVLVKEVECSPCFLKAGCAEMNCMQHSLTNLIRELEA